MASASFAHGAKRLSNVVEPANHVMVRDELIVHESIAEEKRC